LQNIPEQLLEAARLDGAGRWRLTRYVIMPLLRRTFQFATVFVTISSFQIFAPIYVLTRGGPQKATDVAAYHIYQSAFQFFDWGAANAMSMVVVAMLVVITLVELRLLRTEWEY
jgi:ABC-type sugar transport system permease subunit